jgi:hypothetical protein
VRSLRSRFAAIIAAAAILVIAAAPVAAVGNSAMVRVLHASPDAPAVDVYVNDVKVGAPLADLAFGDLSTYVALPAGTYDLKVCASADATICPIVANGVVLTAGTHYTIAATNVLASIEAHIITDSPAPVADKAQVRVVHLSADTPAVDVLTQDGSAKVVANLAYPDATGYLDLAPGSYDLKVCAAADNTVCPLDPGPLALNAGTSYSVFAIGSLSGSTLSAVVGVDALAAPATDVASSATPATLAGGIVLALAGALSLLVGLRLATRPVDR